MNQDIAKAKRCIYLRLLELCMAPGVETVRKKLALGWLNCGVFSDHNSRLQSYPQLTELFLSVGVREMNSISNVFQYVFRQDEFSQQSGSVSSEQVQSAIINRFLQQSTQFYKNGSISLREIRSRLVSTIFDRDQTFNVGVETRTKDDIFNWFISSEHASGLYRRAIEANDLVVESFFRESGVDINHADETTGNTPLMLAARDHQAEVTQHLIAKGADISAVNRRNENAIYQAICRCSQAAYEKEPAFKTIKALLNARALSYCPTQIADIIFTQTDKDIAGLFVDFPIQHFKYLVKELVKNKRDDNPGILEMIFSRHPELVNTRDENQMTLLMIAASMNNLPTLKALLYQPNIDIEATFEKMVSGFNKKWTAYSFAYENGHVLCAKTLKQHGAHVFLPVLSLQEISQLKSRYLQYRFYEKLVIISSLALLLLYPALTNNQKPDENWSPGSSALAIALPLLAVTLFLYCHHKMESELKKILS